MNKRNFFVRLAIVSMLASSPVAGAQVLGGGVTGRLGGSIGGSLQTPGTLDDVGGRAGALGSRIRERTARGVESAHDRAGSSPTAVAGTASAAAQSSAAVADSADATVASATADSASAGSGLVAGLDDAAQMPAEASTGTAEPVATPAPADDSPSGSLPALIGQGSGSGSGALNLGSGPSAPPEAGTGPDDEPVSDPQRPAPRVTANAAANADAGGSVEARDDRVSANGNMSADASSDASVSR